MIRLDMKRSIAVSTGERNIRALDFAVYEIPEPTSIPEPSILALIGAGLAGLSFARRRKSQV